MLIEKGEYGIHLSSPKGTNVDVNQQCYDIEGKKNIVNNVIPFNM